MFGTHRPPTDCFSVDISRISSNFRPAETHMRGGSVDAVLCDLWQKMVTHITWRRSLFEQL
ncbi:hypothetical protein KC19_VG111800 [Ceratodon purpureus]|uniref:Uncharacterized protein n=1 Tax=Ceratodon purpureus TaxID=3225 RepID=A0A8T0HPA8_CERPU|nr:hypothetical protein KC19_VG111800 [Ceratodon purpureus]